MQGRKDRDKYKATLILGTIKLVFIKISKGFFGRTKEMSKSKEWYGSMNLPYQLRPHMETATKELLKTASFRKLQQEHF